MTIPARIDIGDTVREATQVDLIMPEPGERLVTIRATVDLGVIGGEVCVEVDIETLRRALG